jgi:uncharacterized protein YjhX (UPF0386 family)
LVLSIAASKQEDCSRDVQRKTKNKHFVRKSDGGPLKLLIELCP